MTQPLSGSEKGRDESGVGTLALLWLLYAAQGIPFGFQATALVVILREAQASLSLIGLTRLVAIPWLLKPLWAPWVDATGSVTIMGVTLHRRKIWLLPTLGSLALMVAVLAATDGTAPLWATLALTVLLNVAAATMDVAVDGLAVDRIPKSSLGAANVAQVVGYKLGMLAGGGLLLWYSERHGWRAAMGLLAAFLVAAWVVVLFYREVPPRAPAAATEGRGGMKPQAGWIAVWAKLREVLAHRGARVVLFAVLTYKVGETMADAMFKPFLLDHGMSRGQIGLLVGTWGMGFSILGSFVGGYLSSALGYRRAIFWFALVRALPLIGQAVLSNGASHGHALDPQWVGYVTCAEHFAGGALTTAMFALMMSQVDTSIGATHFTVLAAIEVLGKAPSGWISGVLAQYLGYTVVFVTAAVLSLLYLPVARALTKVGLPDSPDHATRLT